MNKLYHAFCVCSYKGGELYSCINSTLKELAQEVDIDIDDLKDRFADDERSQNISDEEWDKLTDLEFLNIIPDDIFREAIEEYFYPGNMYAFDTHSDYEIYTTEEDGTLKSVNICNVPGFIDLVKEHLKYLAKDLT